MVIAIPQAGARRIAPDDCECNVAKIEHAGEWVCPGCGLVLGPVFAAGEFHKFRESAPQATWGTVLGGVKRQFRDARGKPLSPGGKLATVRLRWCQAKITTSPANYSLVALVDVFKLLEIPVPTRDRAITTFTEILRVKSVPNRVILAAACLHWACRSSRVPVSVSTISSAFQARGNLVTPRLIARYSLAYCPQSSPLGFTAYLEAGLARVENETSFSELRNRVLAIVSQMRPRGQNPRTLAARVIYLAAAGALSPATVSQATGVPASSIRDKRTLLH